MDDLNAETLYLKRRVSESLALAAAATEPCARTAHKALARLYGEAIDRIAATSFCLTFGSPRPLTATVQYTVPSSLAISGPMPVKGGSGLRQRRLASPPA